MQKKIQSALISVFYKDGLEPLVRLIQDMGITIYSTGGTQSFIEKLNIPCVPVEAITPRPATPEISGTLGAETSNASKSIRLIPYYSLQDY